MSNRKSFVWGSTVLAAMLLQRASAGAAVSTGSYDLAAVDARLRLAFRHRQAFGSARLADGIAASYMTNALNAYQFDYVEGPGTLHAVGIFYGTSVAMVLDDSAWRTYSLDVVQQRRGDPARRRAAGSGNPYAAATSSLDPAAGRTDLHGMYHDTSLAALTKRQATFLACDNALKGLATDVAVTYGISSAPVETVHADLRAHLVPGTLLVPAGVAAVNQAQELRFTLMPVSI